MLVADDTYDRIMRVKNIQALNKLMEEFATIALAEQDAFMRFQLLASRGSPAEALLILDRLDAADNATSS